jgi:hypothetical protein
LPGFSNLDYKCAQSFLNFQKGVAVRISFPVLLCVPLLVASCGGSSTSPSPGTGGSNSGGGSGSSANGTLTFRVDGTAHTASSITAGMANGILSIAGTDSSKNTTLSFAITPTSAGVGTYTLGPLNAANALIMVGNPAAGWQAGVGIGSGTVTVTSLSSTNAVGTFSFNLTAVTGTATGTKSVTEGVFNVPLTTVPTPPPTTSSSTMSVLIDGVPWTSSLSRRATLTGNILSITGQDTNFRVITFAVPLSGGLLIPPSQATSVSLDFAAFGHGTAAMTLGAQNWDNGHAGGAGTFTVTGISATRVTGTFTVTLVNNPLNVVAVPTAQLTSGTFDMTLERF